MEEEVVLRILKLIAINIISIYASCMSTSLAYSIETKIPDEDIEWAESIVSRDQQLVMNNFKDMLTKAKEMQEKMKETQDIIKKIEVEGQSGGNLVKVVLSGDYELKSIEISEEAKKEKQEIINDLIIAAYSNARENLKKKSSEELSKITGGMNLPFDFKLPF